MDMVKRKFNSKLQSFLFCILHGKADSALWILTWTAELRFSHNHIYSTDTGINYLYPHFHSSPQSFFNKTFYFAFQSHVSFHTFNVQ